jgi:hypothetical protein
VDRRRLLDQPPELVAAGELAEQQQPGEQRQTAAPGDQQCLQRRRPRRGALVVEADQQIGGDAGQLPEREERDDVAGADHAQHRDREEQQHRVEAAECGWPADSRRRRRRSARRYRR